MSLASVSLAPVLSTLFFLAICSLAFRALLPALQRLWKRHARVAALSSATLVVVFLALPVAQATDRLIINGDGCQVTEEDAVGIYLHSDLYLRVDYPDSHWRFGLVNQGMKGLNLVDVSLQAAQFTSRQYIIKRAGLADMFVPYDDRSHTYYDMSFGDDRMDQMDPADLPPQNGALVYLRTPRGGIYVRDTVPKVAVECREAGLGWLCKEPGNHVRRRIHEVVVWSVYDAFNYDYIIQYTFHEDGSISFRDGATGYNLPGGQSKPHVHNPFWRVSTKLFDRTDNEALQFTHVEDSQGYTATDSETPIPTETSVDWNPLEFSTVIIQSATQTNDYGHLMGYEFRPGDRTGTGRFSQRQQDKEMWTHHDEYLTNDDPGEDGSGSGHNNWRYTWFSPDDYLLTYLNNEPIGGTGDGVVLWYISSVHHDPTDNDNQRGNGNRTGITLIHWAGFEMEPHNMFDYNPLGGPAKCGN
jgi:Cu2+-containing amine oxidase